MTQAAATHRVASTIRAELARRRIPQTLVAERLNLSQATVSRRLTGEYPFDVDELEVIAELLGMTPSELIA
jgi:transcriptional regulator with XRE-family HTH domain